MIEAGEYHELEIGSQLPVIDREPLRVDHAELAIHPNDPVMAVYA
jgi:hypothetical protein